MLRAHERQLVAFSRKRPRGIVAGPLALMVFGGDVTGRLDTPHPGDARVWLIHARRIGIATQDV
jgi:hypothetical protein